MFEPTPLTYEQIKDAPENLKLYYEQFAPLQTTYFNNCKQFITFLFFLNGSCILFLLTKNFREYYWQLLFFFVNILSLFVLIVVMAGIQNRIRKYIFSEYKKEIFIQKIYKEFGIITNFFHIFSYVEYISFGLACLFFAYQELQK